jgi:hypothetical protein
MVRSTASISPAFVKDTLEEARGLLAIVYKGLQKIAHTHSVKHVSYAHSGAACKSNDNGRCCQASWRSFGVSMNI